MLDVEFYDIRYVTPYVYIYIYSKFKKVQSPGYLQIIKFRYM